MDHSRFPLTSRKLVQESEHNSNLVSVKEVDDNRGVDLASRADSGEALPTRAELPTVSGDDGPDKEVAPEGEGDRREDPQADTRLQQRHHGFQLFRKEDDEEDANCRGRWRQSWKLINDNGPEGR